MTIPRRARSPRSVVATLAAMLLATELLVVLLAGSRCWGSKDLPPASRSAGAAA